MQAIHASSPWSSLGKLAERVRSLNPTFPAGRKIRVNSAAAAGLSGKVQKAHSEIGEHLAAVQFPDVFQFSFQVFQTRVRYSSPDLSGLTALCSR